MHSKLIRNTERSIVPIAMVIPRHAARPSYFAARERELDWADLAEAARW